MTVPHTRRRDSLTSPAHRGHSAKLKLHKPAVRSVVIIQISRELILLSLMVRRRNLPPRSLRLAVLSQPVTHPSWPVFETHPSIQIVIRSPVSKEKLSSKQHEPVKIMTTTAGSLPLLSFYFGFWLLAFGCLLLWLNRNCSCYFLCHNIPIKFNTSPKTRSSNPGRWLSHYQRI